MFEDEQLDKLHKESNSAAEALQRAIDEGAALAEKRVKLHITNREEEARVAVLIEDARRRYFKIQGKMLKRAAELGFIGEDAQ